MAVELPLAKQHLRVTHGEEDTLIQQYINAAALLIEKMSGNLLTRRVVTQQFSSFSTRLPLFWGPDPDAVGIAYTDTDDAPQTITDARIVGGWLYAPEASWPSIASDSEIEVTYTAGWAEAPADLMSAQLLLVGAWYENRSAIAEKALTEVPLAVDALVQPYRKVLV
jgi:uncharacterized phiE125 gp8 family phage protein